MAKVHTPEPGNERPGAAGALASSLLNPGTPDGPEAPAFRTLTPLGYRVLDPICLETAAGREALAYGRWREERAQANETMDSDKLLDFLAILDLRLIVVAYGRVFPLPTDDLLAAT